MRIDVLGVAFDNLTKDEAVNKAYEMMCRHEGAYVATPNPEIVMHCRADENAAKAVSEADLVIADGVEIGRAHV